MASREGASVTQTLLDRVDDLREVVGPPKRTVWWQPFAQQRRARSLMIETDFLALQAAIAQPRHRPTAGGNPARQLILPDVPDPFVPPQLRQLGTSLNLGVEVLFIQAPAAVGKTTIARHLAASRGVPFLNLAKVPVSTGSLKALISNLALM